MVALRCQELGAVSDAEKREVRNAVYAEWRQDRAWRSEAAELTATINDITEGFDDRRQEEVERLVADLYDNQGPSLRGLRACSQGIEFLLGEWTACRQRLEKLHALSPYQWHHALNLLNKYAKDIMTDNVVRDWAVAALAGTYRQPGRRHR